EMLIKRDHLPERFHLQEFALDHLLREFDESVKNAEIALVHSDLERLHIEPVAGQHALRISPLRVGGRASPTSLGFVDDIVVNQRGGMDDFNYCTEADRAASFIVEQFRGEKEQGRS